MKHSYTLTYYTVAAKDPKGPSPSLREVLLIVCAVEPCCEATTLLRSHREEGEGGALLPPTWSVAGYLLRSKQTDLEVPLAEERRWSSEVPCHCHHGVLLLPRWGAHYLLLCWCGVLPGRSFGGAACCCPTKERKGHREALEYCCPATAALATFVAVLPCHSCVKTESATASKVHRWTGMATTVEITSFTLGAGRHRGRSRVALKCF